NDAVSQAGSNRYSSTSYASSGHRSIYNDDLEMYWNEFVAIFDQKRKRGGRSPTQMYNILSEEIRLSPATLASFYRHQKVPRVTTMDILIPWIEREGRKRVVRFGGNN
ncbi:541_t:CDS:2, partial [Funneliformis geosporum]